MIVTVATVGFRRGKTIRQKVLHLPQPSISAASSSSIGMLVLMAPWNMKVARETEKPTCMRIRVIRLLSTWSIPP